MIRKYKVSEVMSRFSGILLLVAMSMIVSCKKDKKESVGKIVDLNKTNSRALVDFSDKKVQEIYNFYLDIKGALVNSNSEMVQGASKKMENVIGESQDYKQLKATAKLISLTKDVKKQRDFFVTITSEIETMIKKTKISSGEIYKQYCPMAFDGAGGYWLSDSKEIRNPYFGSKMLKCGSVKEVFE